MSYWISDRRDGAINFHAREMRRAERVVADRCIPSKHFSSEEGEKQEGGGGSRRCIPPKMFASEGGHKAWNVWNVW